MHMELFNRRGDLNFPGMLNIVKIPERNNFIVLNKKLYF